jgi:predicted Zn-dependent protease
LATFLQRLTLNSSSGGLGNYLSNHPATEDRIDALQAATQKYNQSAEPLMTAEQSAAAREVCSGN